MELLRVWVCCLRACAGVVTAHMRARWTAECRLHVSLVRTVLTVVVGCGCFPAPVWGGMSLHSNTTLKFGPRPESPFRRTLLDSRTGRCARAVRSSDVWLCCVVVRGGRQLAAASGRPAVSPLCACRR